MKKFLFTTQPSSDLGLLAQSVPIANGLRNRGHDIIYSTSGKAPCKVISDANFSNHRPNWPLYLILTGDTRPMNLFLMLASIHLKRDLGILKWYLNHMKKYSTSEIWNIDHFMYLMGMCNERYTRITVETISKMMVKHTIFHCYIEFFVI